MREVPPTPNSTVCRIRGNCTDSPSLCAVLPSCEAMRFLQASSLEVRGPFRDRRDRANEMHATDVCHPMNAACTRTSCVPGSERRLRVVRMAWLLGATPHGRGRERFTTLRTASVDLHPNTNLKGRRAALFERGPVRPTMLGETVPLTPLSLPRSLSVALTPSRSRLATLVFSRAQRPALRSEAKTTLVSPS